MPREDNETTEEERLARNKCTYKVRKSRIATKAARLIYYVVDVADENISLDICDFCLILSTDKRRSK